MRTHAGSNGVRNEHEAAYVTATAKVRGLRLSARAQSLPDERRVFEHDDLGDVLAHLVLLKQRPAGVLSKPADHNQIVAALRRALSDPKTTTEEYRSRHAPPPSRIIKCLSGIDENIERAVELICEEKFKS